MFPVPDEFILNLIDRFIKPADWYQYHNLQILGFQFIGSKEDQQYAGQLERPLRQTEKRSFGMNPVQPYRDYYGTFSLKTRLVEEDLTVLFAIGYTINSKVVTADDYSSFGWLRLATGLENTLYPNLAHQKQLLNYFLSRSDKPRFVITRVYHYLQTDLYRRITDEILKNLP